MRPLPKLGDPRVRAALALTAAAVFAIGVATAVGRGGGGEPPAATPEQAARELFEATKRGDCDALLSLLTPRFRKELEDAYAQSSVDPGQARDLLCLNIQADPATSLRRVELRDRNDDAAVVVVVVDTPDEGEVTESLPFVRHGDRWLNSADEADCAEPVGAEPADCRRYQLPASGG